MAMVLIILLLSGLYMLGIVLLTKLILFLLATFLIVTSSQFHEDLIQRQGVEARKAIDQATHEFLDQIYLNQLQKEIHNE